MTPNVKFARNVVVGMGGLMLLGALWMFWREPLKWKQWFEMLSGAAFCFIIVRQVNRGEGDWRDEVWPRKRDKQQ